MTRRGIATVQAISTAMIILLAIALVHLGSATATRSTPRILLNQSTLSSSVPYLTASQRAQLLSLIGSARLVSRLVGKRQYTPTGFAVWTTPSGDVLGGAVRLTYRRPMRFTGTWLNLTPPCTGSASPPYTTVPYRASWSGVSNLLVFVDLQARRVVGIQPGAGAHLTHVADDMQKPSNKICHTR